MSVWKNVGWVAVVLAVGHTSSASTVVPDISGRTTRDLQEIDARASDSDKGLCQYAVEDEGEAIARGGDPSIPGTTVTVTNLDYGRLGNHFTIASRFLSLGYCCKAKLVSLPPKDSILAPGKFQEGESGPRYFDFSDAPDVPGFNSSSECVADYTLGGSEAYKAFLSQGGRRYGDMEQKELALCIRSVRLLECEAAYYFPKSEDVCRFPHSFSGHMETPARATESHIETAGNLVIHIRSGDIFRIRKAYGTYGQPPLSYYIGVINNRDWNQVDIVTYRADEQDENPVVPALRMMANIGTWPSMDINIHVDRSIEVDLQAMLCADALAASRSTLGELIMYHTRAKTIFMSSECDGHGSVFGHTSGRLIAARSSGDEYFEVQGLTLRPEAPLYKVYDAEEFTDKERLEMLQYAGLAGMEECTSSDVAVDRWDSASSSRVPLGNLPP